MHESSGECAGGYSEFANFGFPPIADTSEVRQVGQVFNNPAVPKDWNPVVHILDELSEGTHSLTELLYSADQYDGPAYVSAILFLVSQQLIQFSRQAAQSDPLAYSEVAEVWQRALSVPQQDRGTFSHIAIDLTKTGDQVLALLGLGHP